ncbi:MAG: lipopolysaccharide transport periplasmic protein LptA [Gallionella sp.]|nr:lipopolysaccharide transport periplasmic protein LptA [Gallionella sp.]
MHLKNNFATRLVALLLMCIAIFAHAESADRDKPLHLVSDSMTIDDSKQSSTFEGHVELTQGTLQIVADQVVVVEDKQGYQHLTATGVPASFRQRTEGSDEYAEGFGERIEYDTRSQKVDFFKNARVKRGQDEVMGDYITYNSNTEIFEARGNAMTASGKPTRKERVRAVIQPKNNKPESTNATAKQDGVTIQPSPTLHDLPLDVPKP